MDKITGKFLRYPEKVKRFGEGGLRTRSVNKKPKFTLITVVLNNQTLLEKTIKSVFDQNFKNFEYIIIDGGSNDGTLEIIKKYNDKLDYWLSETDKGIYDAFNKGLELSKGEYIGIVNSDDTYRPNALKIISSDHIFPPDTNFLLRVPPQLHPAMLTPKRMLQVTRKVPPPPK